MLLAVINGQKKQFAYLVQIRTNINFTPRICCKNVMNIRLLKKEKKKNIHTKFHNIFHSWVKKLLLVLTFTSSYLGPQITSFFFFLTYYYLSATSIGLKSFVKYFVFIYFLKKKKKNLHNFTSKKIIYLSNINFF